MSRVIGSAACVALKEALSTVYWYKSDLRSFLTTTISKPALLAMLNWEDYKRNIVGQLVDFMAKRQGQYQGELIRLMSEVSRIADFSHLAKLDGGKEKAEAARQAVAALRKHTAGHDTLVEEQRKIEERRQHTQDSMARKSAVRQGLDNLNRDYLALLSEGNPQQRAYKLEKLVRMLFDLCDLDPRASFKLAGEQIDGAFSFESTDYLFEGKWQQSLVSAADLDALAGKLSRKLDNTLGLILSINGFSEDGVKAHSSGRRLMLLMDGSDLMAVLEGRIELGQLLLRKRREASQTGNIYLKIQEIL